MTPIAVIQMIEQAQQTDKWKNSMLINTLPTFLIAHVVSRLASLGNLDRINTKEYIQSHPIFFQVCSISVSLKRKYKSEF